jgi:hypothetical protein
MIGIDGVGISVHLGPQFRHGAEECYEIRYDIGWVYHEPLPRCRCNNNLGFTTISILRAASSTEALFFGENTIHSSRF